MASLVFYQDDDSADAFKLDPEQPATLGRHPGNVFPLSCDSVSSHHAVIAKRDDGWYIQDLGSSNGTRVNGAPVEEARLLDGDRIGFGKIQAVFYMMDRAVATQGAPVLPVPETRLAPAPSPPRRPPAAKVRQVRRHYPGEDTSSVTGFLLVAGLCLFAVVLGLALRHQSETGRNFFTDAFNSLSGRMPRITIEKKEP